jgi:aspartate-alanine antiporter
MSWLRGLTETAPEIFVFAAVALGTVFGELRIKNFALGATACILFVSVIIGQFGHFVIPGVLRSFLFALFVFTIGFRSGPQFFASLNARTIAQVALGLSIGLSGLIVVIVFAKTMGLSPGTAAGVASGSLTQSSMIGTASGALAQVGLPESVVAVEQANIAAAYAVTYILGYVLVLVFVPFVAPLLMGINLAAEAKKLEAQLSGGIAEAPGNVFYQKFQSRTYRVEAANARTVREIEREVGRRAVVDVIRRDGKDIEAELDIALKQGDEVAITGPSAAIIDAGAIVGPEIKNETLVANRATEIFSVLVGSRKIHGRTLAEVVESVGDDARGVFLRALVRNGRDVPITPQTRVYIGDIATLVGDAKALSRTADRLGQRLQVGDKTDMAFFAAGLAVGLAVGGLSYVIGGVPLTLGGGGGALVAGLIWGWMHSRKPTRGAVPPAAQQILVDIGLGGFIACIGLANAQPAWHAVESNGPTLLYIGVVVTLVPMIVGTFFAHRILRMNPVLICGSLAGAMTVDAAVTGACEVARSQTPVLGVAVPYAVSNVVLTVLGPIIVGLTLSGS